jgi:hypothetical protein
VGRGPGQPAHAPTAAGVAVGSVRTIAAMTAPRAVHTATLLRDGTVLVAGGFGVGDDAALASTERYSPATARFTEGPRMTTPRLGHSATLLPDGRFLVAGGFGAGGAVLDTAELYDPATGRFTRTGDMTVRRHKHDAVRLADGRVLLVAGSDERDNAGLYRSAELYDPRSGRFQPTGDLHGARYKLRGTSMLLRDGRVLVAGGASGPEVYQSRVGSFAPLAGSLGRAPLFAAAVLLPDGSTLLCGGYSLTGPASSTAWLIRP